MAPIKFEENIKNKLSERTFEPSENAWRKLSEKLDAHEGKSNNKMIWYIGIAASLVGVLLMTTISLKTGESESILPTVVESPIENTFEIKETRLQEIQDSNLEAISKTEVIYESNSSVSNQTEIKGDKILKKVPNNRFNNHAVAQKSTKNPQTENEVVKNSELKIMDIKLQEALTENTQLEDNKNVVNDSEIESLLQFAQKELMANTIRIEHNSTVDANSLLLEVEADLDESFRDKIFNTIVSGYNTVVTAVAERNN